MVEFIDGPAQGVLMLKRAPLFLRAVVDNKGDIDALDQPDDTPKKTEKIHVYKREGEFNRVHIRMSPRSASGFYMMAQYRYLPDIAGEDFRDNSKWQAWATARAKEMEIETGNS